MMEKPFFDLPQFSIKLSMIMFCGRFAGLFGPCLICSQSNPGNIPFRGSGDMKLYLSKLS